MRSIYCSGCILCVLLISLLFAPVLTAQNPDQIPLKNWPAPRYWQPPVAAESEQGEARSALRGRPETGAFAPSVGVEPLAAASITLPLVFVGMTPCRVVDTRVGQGQIGAFGPPAIGGGATRTIPIPTHPVCSVPPSAKAYSLNVTVVPTGPLYFLTIWPTGQPQPVVSTLNDNNGEILANAAIVPAGTSGSVDIYVTQTTNVLVDINGYYIETAELYYERFSAISFVPARNVTYTSVPGGLQHSGATSEVFICPLKPANGATIKEVQVYIDTGPTAGASILLVRFGPTGTTGILSSKAVSIAADVQTVTIPVDHFVDIVNWDYELWVSFHNQGTLRGARVQYFGQR